MSSHVVKLFKNTDELFQRFIRGQWYNQDIYLEEADILVNRLMQEAEFLQADKYTARFKANSKVFEIWIENYPYSYGWPYAIRDHDNGNIKYYEKYENNRLGVSFKTRRKLRDFINRRSDAKNKIAKTLKVLNDA